jgi:dipeptidyl aminopeptidase/acylaminoacyl peptidase
VWRYLAPTESYLYSVDVATATLTPIDRKAPKAGIRGARFAPDGRSVYVLTDENSEVMQLRYKDPITHENRRVTPDTPWDVEDFDVSADGRYVAYVLNEDGRSRLTVLDTQQKLELSPAGLPEGRIGTARFDRAGRRLAMTAESATMPRDVYVFDVEHNALARWTKSEIGPIDPATLVTPELVRFPTWDKSGSHQRQLSAWVYRPRVNAPVPVIINIHGGPEDQARPEWDPFRQFLVNELGYAVIEPNVRGSSGYGKSFMALDNGELREDAVRDIGSLLVWIGVQNAFDREHVVVIGGSYGGYMTLASMTHYNDRFRCAIDVVGISNWVTFLEHTEAYRRDLRRVEYGDERDPKMREFLMKISPLTSASNITKPMFIVQGRNDPRVPYTEAEQMVAAIKKNGGPVWFLMAKDEGHGFGKKKNQDFQFYAGLKFVEDNLLK